LAPQLFPLCEVCSAILVEAFYRDVHVTCWSHLAGRAKQRAYPCLVEEANLAAVRRVVVDLLVGYCWRKWRRSSFFFLNGLPSFLLLSFLSVCSPSLPSFLSALPCCFFLLQLLLPFPSSLYCYAASAVAVVIITGDVLWWGGDEGNGSQALMSHQFFDVRSLGGKMISDINGSRRLPS
jgi:hypothetical protein